MNRRLRNVLFFCCFVGLCFFDFFNTTVQAEDFQQHGLAKIDLFTNLSPYSCLFYSESRPLSSQLGADGSVVRLKSLKTGFGTYYRAAKKGKDTEWHLYADTKDPKDLAAQFSITHEGEKHITLSSDVAEDFYLYSDPKTFEVLLKKGLDDSCYWELTEDPKCGDTLTVAHLKNKATGGFLMAALDASSSDDATKGPALKNEIQQLEEEIKQLLKDNPLLTIVKAKISGSWMAGRLEYTDPTWGIDGSTAYNVTGEMQSKVVDGVLHFDDPNWVRNLVGYKTPGRLVRVTYRAFGAPSDVTVEVHEGTVGKADDVLHIEANASRHPAIPKKAQLEAKKKELEALGVKAERISNLAKSDIGKTGYDGAPAALSQSTKISIETVTYLPNEDDGGAPKDTIAPGYSMKSYVWAHRSPEFHGHGRYELDNFGPEMIVTVNPLRSRGFAWLGESLPIPGKGTVAFRALSTGGDVHVCFSNSVAPQTVYKIAFGECDNTKTTIYKNGEAVQSINIEQNANARIMPGMIEQMWVSDNNGLFILGKGDPGTGILMAWQDPSPAKNIERVGFSTFESTVKFADVQKISAPIAIIPARAPYVSDSKSIQVGSGDSIAWHRLPLSPADAGTVAFEAKGTEDASLMLGNANNEGYKITFGADKNTATLIERLNGGQNLYKINAGVLPLAALKADVVNKYWVSFYKGLIFIGNGDVGENTFCALVDSSYPKGIFRVGFGGKASIKNLEIWPEVELGLEEADSDYKKSRRFSPFKGSLSIISPFIYKIMQEGPAVRFRDMLTGTMFQVNGTPLPDSDYHFKIDVDKSGLPQITLLYQDPSQEKKSLDFAVKMISSAAESSFRVAQTIAYATGPEIISSSVAIGFSLGAGLIGGGLNLLASGLQARIDQISELGARYIYSEAVQRQAGGSAEISAEAQKNKAILESKLESMLQLQMGDPAQLDYATKQWADAVRLVTDFYVISDTAVKAKFMDGLSNLYKTVNTLDVTSSTLPLFQTVIDTFIGAYNSAYITGYGNAEDEARRDDWYVWINEVSSKIMKESAFMRDGIKINFKGEYLWFPVKLPAPASGSITFEAKAADNVFVGLSENPYKVRNVNSRMYEIIFGKWKNKLTAIHRKSLGDQVATFDHKQYPDLALDQTSFKRYWININKGVISCGVGALGQNKQFDWVDPYPIASVRSVGFSNWDRGVTVKNVRVGTPFESTEKPKANKLPVSAPVTAVATVTKPVTTTTPVPAVQATTSMQDPNKIDKPATKPVTPAVSAVPAPAQAPTPATKDVSPSSVTTIIPLKDKMDINYIKPIKPVAPVAPAVPVTPAVPAA
ncbi:MAG: hypothetical protein US49_C0001G0081 [candidate division TM6 bacterium GW2011_GWF2_37_49]|nr:MAG: hypothetical protein US49_C0001G0081 [candidate division TM6 bacterium GW2011_GWF2_37_49]